MKLFKVIAILSLSIPCIAQTDYKTYIDDKGNIEPVYIDNAIRDLYQNKLDNTTASSTYITKSSTTETYVKKTDISSVYIVVLATNTKGVEGQQSNIAHGVTGSKIVSVNATLIQGVNTYTLPGSSSAGFQYSITYDDTNVYVTLHATESENILNKPVKIIIFYTN
jgi:hypothetical protein